MSEMDSKELRKQKVRDAKTTLILDAALEVLSQKGYYETRLEDIAERAGFSKSALYRYYKDKDEIFFSIAVRERKKVFEKLSTDKFRLSKENHINENLRRLLTVSFTAWGDNFSFLLAMNSFQVITLVNALQKQGELMNIEKAFLCGESEMARTVIAMFDNAKEKKEISSLLDSRVLFEFYQGLVLSRVKKWQQQKKMDDIHHTVDEIVCFLGEGLGFKSG
jgi:AcrR family transcriptional regulator